eukprot:CAMPEP_0116928848 /NCGR_PEP_ID=MMETSP0467-20121206/26221_1 /TAXON_ID=283647 /ORGANISM="Mesodinium pulex, Strain SPMC105" /LENGTH=130 /DNA_ID=CAMNT_0004608687 /DNA_START=223 /DNA_END=615 /DNA_ORIENTATION=+
MGAYLRSELLKLNFIDPLFNSNQVLFEADSISSRVNQSAYSFVQGLFPQQLPYTNPDIKYRMPPILNISPDKINLKWNVSTQNVQNKFNPDNYYRLGDGFNKACPIDKSYGDDLENENENKSTILEMQKE